MIDIRLILETILIIYLFIGIALWLIGIKAFGGMDKYRKYLEEGNNYAFMPVIFLIFVLSWPFFLGRR